MLQNAGVLYILPCKCASRHSGVPFLDIGTSKSGPRVWCFAHFDLKMCFAPQRRAIFLDRNFKIGSRWGVLYILTYKCASHHSGVQFLDIGTSKSAPTPSVFLAFSLPNVLFATAACYLRTRRFSEATFPTSGTTNHWKNTAIRDVANISRTCSFFLVTLHACGSPFCWLDISSLLDTSTLLFNPAYCRKLDF